MQSNMNGDGPTYFPPAALTAAIKYIKELGNTEIMNLFKTRGWSRKIDSRGALYSAGKHWDPTIREYHLSFTFSDDFMNIHFLTDKRDIEILAWDTKLRCWVSFTCRRLAARELPAYIDMCLGEGDAEPLRKKLDEWHEGF
jgi:hypothetical protein